MAKAKKVKIINFDDISYEKQLDRWVQAKRVLENLPAHERKKHWDMSVWGTVTECGTIACAAGHCGMDPWFVERGLDLSSVPLRRLDLETKEYDTIFGDHVEMFFGEAAYKIFSDGTSRSVNAVIKQIDKVITYLPVKNRATDLEDKMERMKKEHDKLQNEINRIYNSI